MKWENININPERLNGLRLQAAQTQPKTTPPKLLDHLLGKEGIKLLTNKEYKLRIKEMEVPA